MAAGALNVDPADPWSAPWFDAFRRELAALGPPALAGRWAECLDELNARARVRGLVNAAGRPLRFVDANALPGVVYERHIWETGEVPTRGADAGGWHDLLNALMWLSLPLTKATLNRLQAQAIAAEGIAGRRGPLRDAATLFDESGALLFGADEPLLAALRAFDWRSLFVAQRAHFARSVRVLVFGHALLDKLRRPYKAACAHAWIVPGPSGAGLRSIADFDRAAAASIDAQRLRPQAFSPLPVLGIPGWCADNSDPRFYEDATVFRSGRRRQAAAGAAA